MLLVTQCDFEWGRGGKLILSTDKDVELKVRNVTSRCYNLLLYLPLQHVL